MSILHERPCRIDIPKNYLCWRQDKYTGQDQIMIKIVLIISPACCPNYIFVALLGKEIAILETGQVYRSRSKYDQKSFDH